MYAFTLVNEQGSATISASDLPEVEIQINSGAWQSLAAAGLTASVSGVGLLVQGLPFGAVTKYRTHARGAEPFSAVDTVATANTTGTSIKELWLRHATQARPAVGAVTPNLMPGLPLVPTPPGVEVVTA